MNFNIRFSKLFSKKNRWSDRREQILEIIRESNPDILALQEVLNNQQKYLHKQLKEDYNCYFVGRRNGKRLGEGVPIYSKKWMKLGAKGTFWLSETPNRPSKSFSDFSYRIVSWIEIIQPKHFIILNTHLAHRSLEARQKSILIFRDFITTKFPGIPKIIVGDFNLEPDSSEYQHLSTFISDAYKIANPHEEQLNTFHGFTGITTKREPLSECERLDRIDYCWVSQGIGIHQSEILHPPQSPKTNIFPSDHWPLVTTFEITQE